MDYQHISVFKVLKHHNPCRPIRRKFTVGLCITLFILGVPMVTQGGAYIFQLVDFYGASGIPILWCCFFQVNKQHSCFLPNFFQHQTIAIGWVYGVNKFASNVEQMTGMLPNRYWVICWGVVAPLVMGVIFLFYCIKVNISVIMIMSDL